jgi:2-dehydro-3-deoxygluconokinase
MIMSRVITFGEIMLRLAPNGYYRFFQNDQMQATFGGGEANVAVSLANYGLDSAYVTKLPAHAIGQAAVDSLRYFGVDTSRIVRGGDRWASTTWKRGLPAGSVCIYDGPTPPSKRPSPTISTGTRSWTARTGSISPHHPALGPNVVEICKDACQAAKAHGVKISCDLNYGASCDPGEARAAMTELCVRGRVHLQRGGR